MNRSGVTAARTLKLWFRSGWFRRGARVLGFRALRERPSIPPTSKRSTPPTKKKAQDRKPTQHADWEPQQSKTPKAATLVPNPYSSAFWLAKTGTPQCTPRADTTIDMGSRRGKRGCQSGPGAVDTKTALDAACEEGFLWQSSARSILNTSGV